jgi:hypothetical protein
LLPNFLIIGAARSGTTTLYSHLQGHPDVYLPAQKRPEPHFFLKSAEYAKGIGYYEERYFSAWRGEKAVGEASTSYLFGPDVPRRVRSDLPGVRLICILRNPIERAFSSYWHTIASGIETLPFAEAINRENERGIPLAGTALGELAPFAYAGRGFYNRQLQRWLGEFDRSRVKIVIFDDFVAAPRRTLADVARFLSISPSGLPDREVLAENRSVPDGAQMLPQTRQALVEIFRDDVAKLGRLLDRDLSHWLKISDMELGFDH